MRRESLARLIEKDWEMPGLQRVDVKNYKSLASTRVALDRLTVLVGPNGAGKSNFVDALRFIKDSLTTSVGQALQNRGGAAAVRRHSRGHPTHFGMALHIDLGRNQEAEFSFEIAARPKGAFEVSHERCIIWQGLRELNRYEVEGGVFKRPVPDIRPRIEPDRLSLTIIAAVEEFRPVYDFLSKMQFYSLAPDQIRQLQEPDAGEVLRRDGGNAAAVLREIKAKKPEVYERLCRLLLAVVPGTSRAEYAPAGQKETLHFKQDVGDKAPWTFSALNMSDGTLRVLGILLAVYQVSSPPLVAVEEPEATIHPAALEVLVDILEDASRQLQVLVTTHSPDILDDRDILDSQIRVVEAHKGRTIIAPLGPRSRDLIRKGLYTVGELHRMGELELDRKEAERQFQRVRLFG